jgi:outer membrane protein
MHLFIRQTVAVLAVAIVAPAAAAQQAPLKFGYINSQRILAEAPGRAEAEAQFEREVGTFRQQIQRMEDSLRTLAQAYQREQASLTPQVRQQRETAIRTQEMAFQQRADTLNAQIQRRQEELVRPIMEQINRVLDGIRAEQRYSFIFDVAAQGQPIVAADTTLDLTSVVIARLRAAGLRRLREPAVGAARTA